MIFEDFKIGDYVKLATEDFGYKGRTAKIVELIPEYEEIKVKFDGDSREITVTPPDIKPNTANIRIKYFDKSIEPLTKIAKGDWIDLKTRVTTSWKAGDIVKLPLNVAMELPQGYEAVINPRSSTFKNYGLLLVNSQGVIDNTYCGDNDEWLFVGYAIKDGSISAGERVCQFRIQENQPVIKFETVETLGNKDRGGFGTTGKL